MHKFDITRPDIVVTAGGTRESIDDVRYIGNFSGGKLGCSIAERYTALGYNALLLAPDNVAERFGSTEKVIRQSFTSAASLQDQFTKIKSARLVLHAAAVADYTPVKTDGKISSDKEELTIRLTRTPKILAGLRDHFGKHTKLVGFKLLSNVTEAELVSAAVHQMKANQTDLCIANDLQEINTNRVIHIVNPIGTHETIEGKTEVVAGSISETIKVPTN